MVAEELGVAVKEEVAQVEEEYKEEASEAGAVAVRQELVAADEAW